MMQGVAYAVKEGCWRVQLWTWSGAARCGVRCWPATSPRCAAFPLRRRPTPAISTSTSIHLFLLQVCAVYTGGCNGVCGAAEGHLEWPQLKRCLEVRAPGSHDDSASQERGDGSS